jgi:hypothetical protein
MSVISLRNGQGRGFREVKRWVSVLIGVVALAGGAAGGAWAMRGVIATALMQRAYERAMAHDPLAELPDGLHVRPVPRPRAADLPRTAPGRPGRGFRQHAGWRDANQLYQPPTQHLVDASRHPAWTI